MNNLEEKFYLAATNILENNLKINDDRYKNNPIIFVYDSNSPLSRELSAWYIKSLENNKNAEIINFDEIDNNSLKEKLLDLKENSTVVLVQSTNFRLEDFRIRVSLHKAWVGCLEHNHLAYIKDDEIENYADVIEYKTPYFEELSEKLKNLSDNAESMTFICNDWSKFELTWWFEDMKQNTWNYEWKNRWWSFPIWENFTEIIDFSKANWELSIYAYPNEKLEVEHVKPFKIYIKESLIECSEEAPVFFKDLIQKVKDSEDWECYLRELWFWLNNWISREKRLSDVNAYERVAGFHVSLWKKHGIYRKKFHRKVTQRYHIDIFPDIFEIYIDNKLIFKDEKFTI